MEFSLLFPGILPARKGTAPVLYSGLPYVICSWASKLICDCFQVTCEERYSDLEKCVYLPSPINGGFSKETYTYEKKYELKNSGEFVRLHPCAQLGPKQVRNQNQQMHSKTIHSSTNIYGNRLSYDKRTFPCVGNLEPFIDIFSFIMTPRQLQWLEQSSD